MEKNRVTVLVAGQKFTIISEESEKYIIDLASKIDARITALTMKNMTREKAAVLTALNFADDMEKDKKAQAEIKEQIKDYIKQVEELSSECESLKAQADALKEEKEKERIEKEALQKIVKDLQSSIESFRIESAKMVSPTPVSDEPEPIENTEPPEEREQKPPVEITDDGDLSFETKEEKPAQNTQSSFSSKKKKHRHSHDNPYKQNYMKKQEEKGYTPLRQYSLFEDE